MDKPHARFPQRYVEGSIQLVADDRTNINERAVDWDYSGKNVGSEKYDS